MVRPQTIARLALLAACGVPALAGCNLPLSARALDPTPNLVTKQAPIRIRFPVVQAPPGEYCAKTPNIRDMCVEGFRQALWSGLVKVLRARAKVFDGAPLSAELRMVSFNSNHASANAPNVASLVSMSMTWQFVVRDQAGNTVMALNETTFGPAPIVNEDEFPLAVKALMNAVLERIGGAIAEHRWEQDQPASAKAAQPGGCVPGATQECVGPGACRGGQACRPDGSGYEPCDCGTATKM